MPRKGISLDKVTHIAGDINHITKDTLQLSDCLMVKTRNSLYAIKKVDDKQFEIRGGWFEKKGQSPSTMIIRGCTWGGSIIHIHMAAAIGLCLEFGNNVITSPVTQIYVIKAQNLN